MRSRTRRVFASFAALAALVSARGASAQPAPPPPARPVVPLPPPTPPGVTPAPDPLAVALEPVRGGLTAEEVARVASATRASVRTKQEELRVAQARVDQALVQFFPRVSVSASYTRTSPLNLAFGGSIIGTQASGPVTVGACSPGAKAECLLVGGKAAPVAATPFSFALPVDNYAFTGSVSLPVSDYVFRLVQGYTAASHVVKARQLSADAEALQVAADGRVAFYNWVRAKGQTVVAKESVDAARAHVVDAKHAFDVGYISKADVLRLEAQVASAEQLEAQAEAFESVAAEQLRTVMAAPPGRPLALGVDVLGAPTPLPDEDLATLDEQALKQRLEIRALDETIASLKQVENVTAAGYLPRVDAFADGMYANPNPRVFPPASKWDFTWDLGVRASWTLNDTFSTLAATSEARAQTRAAIEQRAQIRDALRLEVANAASDARQAQASLAAAERGLAAAEESLRVRRELFKNGKATSVDLVDAETEATRARLARLDAHVGLLAAKARLDHATGRDARQLRPAAP